MASKPPGNGLLVGQAAADASLPLAQTPRGGQDTSFRGESQGNGKAPTGQQQGGQPGEQMLFAGMGPDLEDDDKKVYNRVDGLVLRQELIAQNHLAQDSHWTCVKLGYPWSILEKEPNRSLYKWSLPYGQSAYGIQPIPNKTWDMVNKTTSLVLSDFPQLEAEPLDDSEEAKSAAEMANRFLKEDATEHGTSDAELFNDRFGRALVCASSYIEYWVDPTGGGYIPLQILAHPQAQSPEQPFVGPDGNPSANPVLRYVTADGQFTTDPSQAAPQWQPKIRASKWGREHWRCYPESLPMEECDTAIGLLYCTLSQAKQRWQAVADMSPEDLSKLCSWTPARYLPLLPLFQRARWQLSDGREKEKGSSSDERIMFYYQVYHKARPLYPKGADVVISGAFGGFVIEKELLAADVEVNKGQEKVKEVRCREIPVVQITPVKDPDEMDPTGRAFVEMFGGAAENQAYLSASFAELLDYTLHPQKAVSSTSPLNDQDPDGTRIAGEFLYITKPDDIPFFAPTPTLPASFFNLYELGDNGINSIANQNRPAQGSDNQQEVSGKARQIAVSQNNVGLTPMQHSANNAYARAGRIKIELCMAKYTTAQQIRYVGEDGSYKQDEWTGTDFALIGKVSIKAGTGTMMTPDQKVQYFGNLSLAGLLDQAEAKEAARPAYAQKLGLTADPVEQYVERCMEAWRKGPPAPKPPQPDPMTGQPVPAPTWQQERQQYVQAKGMYDQAQASYQQQLKSFQQGQQNRALAAVGESESQPEQVKAAPDPQVRAAKVALVTNPAPADPPQPPQIQPPQEPYNPLADRPIDTEPVVANLWMRKCKNAIASVKFTEFDPLWAGLVVDKYNRMRQAVAMVAATPQPPQIGQTPPQKLGAGKSTPNTPSSSQQPESQQAPGNSNPTGMQ